MPPQECYDRVHLSLSDESGDLRFESFEIAGTPECRDVEETLRAYLVERPLAEVDMDYIRGLTCAGDGQCMSAVVRVIEEYQHLFVRDERNR